MTLVGDVQLMENAWKWMMGRISASARKDLSEMDLYALLAVRQDILSAVQRMQSVLTWAMVNINVAAMKITLGMV